MTRPNLSALPRPATIRAEWTKLRSTKLLFIGTGITIGVSLVIVALVAAAMSQHNTYCASADATCTSGPLEPDPTVTLLGLLGDGTTPGVGMLVLMVLGAMVLLSEYRYSTMGTTLMVTPSRRRVALSKAALVAGLTFVVAFLVAFASSLIFTVIAKDAAQHVDSLRLDGLLRDVRAAAFVMLSAIFALALGLLLRNAIAAVAVAVLWPTLLETIVPQFFANSADRVAGFMPFVNARRFVGMETGANFPWGPAASGAYFLAVVCVLLLLGVETLRRVDYR